MNKLFLREFIVTITLITVCLCISEKLVIQNGYLFYLVQLVFLTVTLSKQKENYIFFLSPTFITYLYVNLSFTFGHYVVSRGIEFDLIYFNTFNNYLSVKYITVIFMLFNFFIVLGIPKTFYKSIVTSKHKREFNISKFLLGYGLLILLSFLTLDLEAIGGGSNYGYSIKLGVAIIVGMNVARLELLLQRFLIYVILIIPFLAGNFESKREIMFVLLLFSILEISKAKPQLKLSFKTISLLAFGTIMFISLILTASILRGYGGYKIDRPIDAIKYLPTYVSSDFIGKALAINFELSTTYGNSSNAIDYINKGEVDYLYGSTFLKVLFLPIPRKLFPHKPQSMVNIYTKIFAPGYHAIGSTRPIVIYSEFLWNFGIFGFPLITLMFIMFNRLYYKLLVRLNLLRSDSKTIFGVFLYITLIQFIRGAGFELWLIYGIVQFPFTYMLSETTSLNKEQLKIN